jgi:hypothetical protein
MVLPVNNPVHIDQVACFHNQFHIHKKLFEC